MFHSCSQEIDIPEEIGLWNVRLSESKGYFNEGKIISKGTLYFVPVIEGNV